MEQAFLTKLPTLLRGSDYNPEQWLDNPDILQEDIRLMKAAGMNTATLGVFSWSSYEPREGEFHFDWLRKVMDALYAAGIYTELATPSGAKPAWLAYKYHEVLRFGRNGVRDHQGGRHNHCPSSPLYREKVACINEKLVQAVGDHPGLILWHVSNELSGECYCPRCAQRFIQWLKGRYHDNIDALNHAWWTGFWSHGYTCFEEIEPPFENGETSVNGLLLDWRRFGTWNMADYLHAEIAQLRSLTPNIPITSNFMEYYPDLDYHALSRELDIISWDSYPRWGKPEESIARTAADTAFDHALLRGCKPGKPFMLMECTPSLVNWQPYNKLKRPGVCKLSAVHAVACGADAVQYFQWRKSRGSFEQFHGAVVDHDGREDARVFREVAVTNRLLERLGPVCSSVSRAKAAMIFDWDNRWALDDAAGLEIKNKKLEETCRRQYELFVRQGVELDVISQESDLAPYRLLLLPMVYLLKPGFAVRLRAFVEAGGTVVATYLLGYVDQSTLCHLGGFPGDGLRELFGVTAREVDTLYPGEYNGAVWEQDGCADKIEDYCELLELWDDTTEVLARYQGDFYAQTPVVTSRVCGKGTAFYMGARLASTGLERVLRQALACADIAPKHLPEGVEYHLRETDTEQFHFYLNMTDKEVPLPLPQGMTDLCTGLPSESIKVLEAYGAYVLQESIS